jgi:hypothetical protein
MAGYGDYSTFTTKHPLGNGRIIRFLDLLPAEITGQAREGHDFQSCRIDVNFTRL